MARLYPTKLNSDIPEPERRVYETLGRSLPNEFTLIHRINFPDPEGGRRREVDMLLIHPNLGLLAIEVQGGQVGVGAGGQWQWRGAGSSGNIENPYKRTQDDRAALSRWLRSDQATAANEMTYNRHIGFAVALPDTDAAAAKLGLTASPRNTLDEKDMREPAAAINRIMAHGEPGYQMAAPLIAALTSRLTGLKRGGQGAIAQPATAGSSNRVTIVAGIIALVAVIGLLGWLLLNMNASKPAVPAVVAAQATATTSIAASSTPIVAALIPTITPKSLPTRITPSPVVIIRPSATPAPPQITVGKDALVSDSDGLYVRTSPSRDAEAIVKLAGGVKVHVVGGPQSDGDRQWWQVSGWPDSSSGQSGWCAGSFLKPVQ